MSYVYHTCVLHRAFTFLASLPPVYHNLEDSGGTNAITIESGC